MGDKGLLCALYEYAARYFQLYAALIMQLCFQTIAVMHCLCFVIAIFVLVYNDTIVNCILLNI